jgi:hypothetical protein
MQRISVVLLLSALFLNLGCGYYTPTRTHEIGVIVAESVVSSIPFFAYTTPLPVRPPEHVLLVVAPVVTLEGRISLEIPESVSLYPIRKSTDKPTQIVHPLGLAALAPDLLLTMLPERQGRAFALGYFAPHFGRH